MFILVGLIAASAFVVGVIEPRAAWRWALLIALGVPVVEVIASVAGLQAPYAQQNPQAPDLVMIFVLTFAVSLVEPMRCVWFAARPLPGTAQQSEETHRTEARP